MKGAPFPRRNPLPTTRESIIAWLVNDLIAEGRTFPAHLLTDEAVLSVSTTCTAEDYDRRDGYVTSDG
jgi:hypothetical protein